jgi:RES domain-containing protein
VPTVWRIVKQRYAAQAFDSDGARRFGGRWNSRGVPVVYAACSRALAALELLVHVERSALLSAYVLIGCEVDDTLVDTLDPTALPAHWRQSPAPHALARIGDAWARAGASLALAVPSALVPDEPIYLLNPKHSQFYAVRLGVTQRFDLNMRFVS